MFCHNSCQNFRRLGRIMQRWMTVQRRYDVIASSYKSHSTARLRRPYDDVPPVITSIKGMLSSLPMIHIFVVFSTVSNTQHIRNTYIITFSINGRKSSHWSEAGTFWIGQRFHTQPWGHSCRWPDRCSLSLSSFLASPVPQAILNYRVVVFRISNSQGKQGTYLPIPRSYKPNTVAVGGSVWASYERRINYLTPSLSLLFVPTHISCPAAQKRISRSREDPDSIAQP